MAEEHKVYEVPPELSNLLLEFTIQVLTDKPDDLVDFAAEFFNNLRLKRNTEGESSDTDIEEEKVTRPKALEIKAALGSRFGRRFSVSSESYHPEDDVDGPIISFPKTEEQLDRLMKSVKKVFLFRALDSTEMNKVIDAMSPKTVKAGEIVIKQGDDGDFFYIIEEGNFEAYSEKSGESRLIMTYEGSGSFGELALMYNVPRAATITATTDGFLWVLNRNTFRRLLLRNAHKKRQQYDELISKVPALQYLSDYERMNLCDALIPVSVNSEDYIIRQGEVADGMYFIEQGVVRITKKNEDSDEETEVAHLTIGDYFGERALVTKSPRAASASAITNVQLAFLDIEAFERLLGPCMGIIKRKIEHYEAPIVGVTEIE